MCCIELKQDLPTIYSINSLICPKQIKTIWRLYLLFYVVVKYKDIKLGKKLEKISIDKITTRHNIKILMTTHHNNKMTAHPIIKNYTS